MSIFYLASIEPAWTRFAIPLLGVVMFLSAATIGQRRPTRITSLVVLTIVLGLWLFGEGLVWSERGASMVRGGHAWAQEPSAWQWSGLLVLAYATVLTVAGSLRSFSGGRRRLGWLCAALAVVLFAAWSAVVRYSPLLGVAAGCVALVALLPNAQHGQRAAREEGDVHIVAAGPGAVVVAATVLITFWVVVSFLWFVFGLGEDVQCNCWADNHDGWQYVTQLLVTLAGSAGLAIAARSYLRRNATLLVAGGVAAVIALAAWIVFYESSMG